MNKQGHKSATTTASYEPAANSFGPDLREISADIQDGHIPYEHGMQQLRAVAQVGNEHEADRALSLQNLFTRLQTLKALTHESKVELPDSLSQRIFPSRN